jgi:hypothetical protein
MFSKTTVFYALGIFAIPHQTAQTQENVTLQLELLYCFVQNGYHEKKLSWVSSILRA